MEDLINKALAPASFHDGCFECGKRTDGLTTCTYPHDGSIINLCPDCIKHSGFCLGCGLFSSGMESFDFSEIEGYCEDCVHEIKTDLGEFDQDDEFVDEDEDFPNGSLDY